MNGDEMSELRRLLGVGDNEATTEVVRMKSSQRGRRLLLKSKRLQDLNRSPLAIIQVQPVLAPVV